MALLNRNNLQIAALASKESSKYTLQGILVEPERTIVTDGHLMVIVETPNGFKAEDFPMLKSGQTASETFTPFIYPADAALEAAKALPKKTRIPILLNAAVVQNDETHATLAITDLERERSFCARKPSGTFPNWKAVMPKIGAAAIEADEEKGTPAVAAVPGVLEWTTLNIDVIVPLLQNLRSIGVESFTMRGTDKDGVLRLDGMIKETGQAVTALVMPMRGTVEAKDWDPAPVEIPAPVETLEEKKTEEPETVAA